MSTSSYDPHRTTAGGFDAEIERLERQTALQWTEERAVLAGLPVPPDARVAEIGCGSGALTRRLPEVWSAPVLALDRSRELIARAPGTAPRAVGDALALPLADGSVDVALLRYVLQHLPAPAAAIAEARRVLAPGGRVVIVDVDAQLWGAAEPALPALAAIYRKVAVLQAQHGGDRSVARRAPRLLADAGFVDVQVLPFATTSDAHPVEEFALHAGPERLLPLVHSGELALADYGLALQGWQQFCAQPDAWVMALGFVITGRVGGAV